MVIVALRWVSGVTDTTRPFNEVDDHSGSSSPR